MKRILSIFMIFIMLFATTGCSTKTKSQAITKTIGEMASDANGGKASYIIVFEGQNCVPYYVVSNNYQGKTLLLRMSALPQEMSMSTQTGYLNSDVDKYLNSEYLDSLNNVAKLIYPTTIDVFNPLSSEKAIERKVFLLSFSEMGFKAFNEDTEGLEFFKDEDHSICYEHPYVKDSPRPVWLRDSYFTNESDKASTMYVNEYGKLTSKDSGELCGVRPAFCVNSDELVVLVDLSGKTTASGTSLGWEYVLYTSDAVPYIKQPK